MMSKKQILNEAYVRIEDFRDKLGEVFVDTFMEADNSSYEVSKSIIAVFDSCQSEREVEIADHMLIAICGYSIETLISKIDERDAAGHVWESC